MRRPQTLGAEGYGCPHKNGGDTPACSGCWVFCTVDHCTQSDASGLGASESLCSTSRVLCAWNASHALWEIMSVFTLAGTPLTACTVDRIQRREGGRKQRRYASNPWLMAGRQLPYDRRALPVGTLSLHMLYPVCIPRYLVYDILHWGPTARTPTEGAFVSQTRKTQVRQDVGLSCALCPSRTQVPMLADELKTWTRRSSLACSVSTFPYSADHVWFTSHTRGILFYCPISFLS